MKIISDRRTLEYSFTSTESLAQTIKHGIPLLKKKKQTENVMCL